MKSGENEISTFFQKAKSNFDVPTLITCKQNRIWFYFYMIWGIMNYTILHFSQPQAVFLKKEKKNLTDKTSLSLVTFKKLEVSPCLSFISRI